MWNIIRGDDRYQANHGWLTTYHHFSFGEYHDPANMHFGTLRVFNEDFIAPHSGFPLHPHSDMEIVSLVLGGTLTHKDSEGNRKDIRAGDVQRMSAGTGVMHSEYNHGDEEVHLLQVWVLPDKKGLPPEYDQRAFTLADRSNTLLPVVGVETSGAPMMLHQDATFYVSRLASGDQVSHVVTRRRRVYLFVVSGAIDLGDTRLEAKDQLRGEVEAPLTITARKETDLVLIDLAV